MKLQNGLFLGILLFLLGMGQAGAQGLKAFKLRNGMSVYVWEDSTKTDVLGQVVVRTGSVNDPEQYTGLAHYLEHVLFKGTQKIGALDWEKEKPLYEQIIAKYDAMAEETDPVKKEAISKEINELTVEAGKVSLSNEFSELIEGMGGTGLNAGTSWDYTVYYNTFPPYQINKWLEISSERFVNPVFRTFQSELETVYEEYNRGKDNPGTRLSNFMLEKAFPGHPYSRSIIGLGEHLKNPRLSQLIKYYEDWYTPENMALVLVGKVETRKIMGRIAAAFGKLQPKATPERKTYADAGIKGRSQHTTKFSQYPSVMMIYNGVKAGHPDETALDICLQLLSNASSTGTLDKLVIDGDLQGGDAQMLSFREQGRSLISAIPYYDEAQRRFESNKSVEKKMLKAIQQVAAGEFAPWVVEAIKVNMCRDFDLMLESNEFKAELLTDAFINEEDMNRVLDYKNVVMNVSMEDIKRVAKEYLTDNYVVIFNEQGKPEKYPKIKKPGYKPIEPPVGQSSLYARQFKNMATSKVEEKFVDWAKVQERQLNDYSRVYYTPNTENDVFTLVLKYGAGTEVFPKLGYAANLMGNAGILGNQTPQELKEELSKLHATCNVQADKDYLYVTLRGYENTLQDACLLLTRQLLMPGLDEKQMKSLIGSAAGSRVVRKDNVNQLAAALNQYIMYGDNSPYRKELTDKQLVYMGLSELTGNINEAIKYAAEIHYSGTLPFETVYQILSNSLPLVAGERPTKSPVLTKMQDYKESTVYFIPNGDAQQSQIYFYIPMGEYKKELRVKQSAFNQYMSGGFSGLIMNEIREKNSMAYTAYGMVRTEALPGAETYFTGYVGTQNDKTVDAVKLYMNLLTDMPERPERIDNIKSYLRQAMLTDQPDARSLSEQIARWKLQGYTEDPTKEMLPMVDQLTFQDIVDFYNTQLKGKPIVIGIVGNPKEIDVKQLEQFGKVVKLNEKKLFNEKDVLF
ncbi:MAG: insulinase family protein [Bacteroides sp.]|nr:insulinase family protein [Bacteroides sp.]